MKKIKNFFQSINFKIALVFALLLFMTFQIVGAVFIQRLRNDSIKTFKQRIELSTYTTNSLIENLSLPDTRETNNKINKILEDVNKANVTEMQVVDAKGTIRGDNNVNNKGLVGQKTTDLDINKVLYNGRSFSKLSYEKSDKNRYYISITPLFNTTGGNSSAIGAIYVKANMETVYDSIDSVVTIFATASLIATVIGLGLAILVSREITRPIEEMKKQTEKIAKGDYSGYIRIYSNDELGQLSREVNNLSIQIRRSQETSNAERRRLDSVLAHMSDGVIATDRKGRITIINGRAADDLNVDSKKAIGVSILDILNIRNKYTLRDLIDNQDEIVLDFSDSQREHILNAYFSLIQRESGFISGLVCVLHDVTEQQKIDRERRQFVSNVSHELRTPLTSVKSYIESLSDGAWKDPVVAPTFLKVTQDETERMIRMINQLLSLSRMDSGRVKLNLELVNINELFNYILNRFDMMLDKDSVETQKTKTKNYTIKRKFTKEDLWVELDTDKFIQVIDNIMNNAIKYSPDGGVITCNLLKSRNHVILSISDQGLGIPKKDLKHVFDRFFRVDKARSRAQGGTGLGLSISRDVIKLLKGKIWVDSVESKGSTFYISLPYEEYEEDSWDA